MATVAPMKGYNGAGSFSPTTNAVKPVQLSAAFAGAPKPGTTNPLQKTQGIPSG